jgi:predicted nucleic acid-binding protein
VGKGVSHSQTLRALPHRRSAEVIYRTHDHPRRSAQPARVEVGEAGIERSIEIQTALARKGQHRGVTIPDLLIAAAAEAAGLTVLHYDSDFDAIAGITGQPAEWVVPQGSVP